LCDGDAQLAWPSALHAKEPWMARDKLLAALAACALGSAALPGHADTFPNNYDQAVADDSIADYCLTSSFTTDAYIAHDAMWTLDDTTDMSDSYTLCYLYTDVWWYEENLDPGVRGQRTCFSYSSSNVCNSNDVKMDLAEIDVGSDDWYDLGHSVGLDHDTESAMISGEVPSTASQWRNYSSHDIGHINTQY
jgi:hypothetical protein